ncbi:MAG: response regulator [Lachnospiraceae bacterium]|nr:response regulator [Lachnospiraceae bacterium]
MDKNVKKGFSEIIATSVKVLMGVLLTFNIFVLIYFGIIDRADVWENEPISFIENWIVTDSKGNQFTTGRNFVSDEEIHEEFTIVSTLAQDIADNEYLFFLTRTDIAVYINGELRKDFIEDRDVNIPGGLVTKFYMTVPLKESDAGAEVKMVRPLALKDEELVPETFIGTRSAAFSYMLHNGGLSFFLAAIVLIFSIVVIIVSVVLKLWYKIKINMLYGALGILITASWLITDSFVCPFVFRVYYVHGLLNYMFGLMIPFALALYLNAIQGERYKKSVSALLILASFNAVVWPFLHFTGIVPFYNIRSFANGILAIITVLALYVVIKDAIKGNVSEYRYTFLGFLGFLICCTIELVIVLTIKTTNATLPMVIGLGVLLTFIVMQQVKDLRKINQEKQHAIDISEAKTRFLASMSHEIRTPINAILGMNEMILRENKDKVIGEYSRSIKTSGKMLLMLVNDVLDFSKIEAGKLEINENRFRMSDMLHDVISLVKERADEKSLEIKTEINGEIPNELISDEFRIRQILVNLINNAVKYTEKGTVTLKLGGSYTDDGYELGIYVKDTGKGIRKEDQKNLFDAFSRADAKANVNIEGTGLGLAIVKSIVDSMNGTLGLESEYGSGSEFWVKIPVKYLGKALLKKDFMEESSHYEATIENCSFTAPAAKILAVDDNQSNLTIVKLFLKRTGIKPDLCSNGKRAIELCREKKYDIIFLDHMMPQPDGIETFHIIRSDEKSLNKDTKTVILTANALAGSRQMYINEGFDDYLTKPLDSAMLEQTVLNMLPKEKVELLSPLADRRSEEKDEVIEFNPGEMPSVKERLTAIKGLDYETALGYCGGDEEMLEEIITDVAADGPKRVARMKKNLEEKDIKAYRIEAHTVKSTVATIGMKELSERAKKHEYAARDNDLDFIYSDSEDFIKEYLEVCKKLI